MNRVVESAAPAASVVLEVQSIMPLARQFRWFRFLLAVADTVALTLSFGIGYWLRFTLLLSVSPEALPTPSLYVKLGLVFVPVWIALFYLLGAYERGHLLGGTREYARLAQASTLGMALVVLGTFLFIPLIVVARGWVIYSWILAMLLVAASRFLIRRGAYFLRTRGYLLARTVIVSGHELEVSLVEDLSDQRSSGLFVLGFLSDSEESAASFTKVPRLGNLSALPELLRTGNLDELIVDMRAVSREQLLEIMQRTAEVPKVRVRVSTGLYEILATGLQVRTVGSVPLTSLPGLRLNPLQRALKGLMDYTGAGLGLILLSPLFLLLAGLVKWTSPGPVLHRRKVLGTGGRQFGALKFRTMVSNSAELLEDHPELLREWELRGKIRGDPRVTSLGQFLRKYSLDELPQLLNVVAGQMSLVGPRFITPEELSHFGPFGPNLLTVKPGMTGLWQVSGRSDLDYAHRVRLDMAYIRNYSIWKDLQILLVQTIPTVLKGKGAL